MSTNNHRVDNKTDMERNCGWAGRESSLTWMAIHISVKKLRPAIPAASHKSNRLVLNLLYRAGTNSPNVTDDLDFFSSDW